ncbi:AAA family ATPase [Spiroplasma endosymbiont of Melieria omissa]|uniref:AAA family ATPase n=1 Tax=Spiroplasma endosymbiont of Melieria omissa TaxID=3139324 RepID=UPI003CCB3DE5
MLNFKIKEFKSIVKEIEFKVYPKKISFIVGKNGLGKSNILDAIDWFVNGASNSSNSNNISSQSTSPNYNSKAIVSLKYKLSEEKIKKINDILKEHYNILSDRKLVNSYIEKTADSPAYNYLYESSGNLTELAEIINGLIKLYSEKWLDPRFFKISTKGNYSVNLDLTREKLEKWTEMTKNLKEKHIKLFDDIKLLESLYKERPILIYIRNADLENKTKYSYYFDEYTQKEKNKEFMDLLRFLGNDVLNEMTRLTEMNSVDENEKTS